MNQMYPRKANIYGTREWSTHSVNCCTGCSHDCRYCYARAMAVRSNRVRPEEWKNERVRPWAVNKRYPKMDGTVMFPSAHDITPGNFAACLTVLRKLLQAGNRVLVVSKPHYDCIVKLCAGIQDHRDRILFRFTIGACDDEILSFWERNAPSFEERKRALAFASRSGFGTSVSAEPLLDSDNVDRLIEELSPFITDSLWIGKMNDIRGRVEIQDERTREQVRRIESGQTDHKIREIYHRYQGNPLIKWKGSIKRVVGLPLCERPGMDR